MTTKVLEPTRIMTSAPRPVRRRNVLLDAPLLFRSSVFGRVVDEAKRAAQASSMILLEGESGSGKGRIARLIHEHSGRAGAFAVWSGPEFQGSIAISEIFGHRKGAFTGADAERPGLFQSASGGTVLADDIDKLEKPLQGVVLRFLDDFCVRPVGSVEMTPVDLLFIASTNRNLHELGASGEFLFDLANRLTSLVISIPPLRERREDIAPMAEHFIAEYSRAHQVEIRAITPEAMRLLEGEEWPGNVRGLASVIENAVFRATQGTIDAEVVIQALGRQATRKTPAPEIATLPPEERKSEAVIRRALEACDWNGAAAADLLGIPLRTFRRCLSRYGIRKRFL
jgi:DNA-binding NtrC family response regulator